jgi:hypothetical protein
MKNKNGFENALLTLLGDDILSESEGEMCAHYRIKQLTDLEEYKTTKSLIDVLLLKHKKSRLLAAKAQVNEKNNFGTAATSKGTIQRGRDFLINLMVQGKLPNDLTVAFREGKDLPDDEVASLIEDLKDLGFDVDSHE